VKAYNLKLEELEEAALQLAKSERESAWREMAKQVAHEIKNPLTPMKLSIQQLLRVYDPNDPNSEQKVQKVANSIIEQIDALTKIANEFSRYAVDRKMNIHEIIAAANSQPFSHIHIPGISVGGHCIPIYPQFYLWNDPQAKIVATARKLNSSMPIRAVDLLKKRAGPLSGKKIIILGVSYRPGVKETAFSGSLELLRLLNTEGAEVYALDPLYSQEELISLGFSKKMEIEEAEIIILHTSHEQFATFDFSQYSHLKYVLDGRNFIRTLNNLEKVELIKF
jgi:UDP-N-acetyl-D-mannosaminuronate dehydrogenase